MDNERESQRNPLVFRDDDDDDDETTVTILSMMNTFIHYLRNSAKNILSLYHVISKMTTCVNSHT